MEVVTGVDRIRSIVAAAKAKGRVVGVVPTMGFFHRGHLELMRVAREECDLVVVTLFVNPAQFGPGEDLDDYPRDFENDRRLADEAGVDYLFSPPREEMYPEGFCTAVKVEGLSSVMCGESRPCHFGGVATVVATLFNTVPAQRAYFGEKDAQQLVIIRRMAKDLDFPVEIVGVPTVREPDGLAMSSRNAYLSEEERKAASVLHSALQVAARLIDEGEASAFRIEDAMREVVEREPLVRLEYISICDNIYLSPLQELSGEVLVALAARLGKARLIDNMLFRVNW